MRVGNMEVKAEPVPGVAVVGAGVRITVSAGAWFTKAIEVPTIAARELAAQLLQAANQAEGKS